MTYLSKTCVSTKMMFAGLAHKKYLKKQQQQQQKKLYIQKTTKKHTYLPNMLYISNQI